QLVVRLAMPVTSVGAHRDAVPRRAATAPLATRWPSVPLGFPLRHIPHLRPGSRVVRGAVVAHVARAADVPTRRRCESTVWARWVRRTDKTPSIDRQFFALTNAGADAGSLRGRVGSVVERRE